MTKYEQIPSEQIIIETAEALRAKSSALLQSLLWEACMRSPFKGRQ